MSPCLRLFNSKWIVVMSPLWCTLATNLQRFLQAVLFTLFFVKVHIVCFPARRLLRKSLAAKGPTISTMAKTDGHVHLLGLTEKRIWCWDGSRMNRPVLDPRRIQKGRGVLSGSSLRPSAPRGPSLQLMALLDVRPKYWVSPWGWREPGLLLSLHFEC